MRFGHPTEPSDLPRSRGELNEWIRRRDAAKRHKPKWPQEPEQPVGDAQHKELDHAKSQ